MVATIEFDGLTICRVLNNLEQKSTSSHPFIGERSNKLIKVTYLTNDEYSDALNFLYRNDYVRGSEGENGPQFLTEEGRGYLRESTRNRQINNLIAEQILKELVASSPTGDDIIQHTDILEKYALDEDQYIEACQELDDLGFFSKDNRIYGTNPFVWIQSSTAGRIAWRRNFILSTSQPSSNQIGVQISGGTIENVQGVAQAIHSQVKQTIDKSNQKELMIQIADILQTLVEEITEGLSLDHKQQYSEAAAELEKELSKDSPEQVAIQKWMARLAFLEKGTDIGNKTIQLMNQAMPSIVMLGQLIQALLAQ